MKIAIVGAALLAACSSSSSGGGPGGACSIEGAYTVSYTRDATNPGDCTGASDLSPETLVVTVSGSEADLQFQSVGGSCPAKISGCKVTGACVIRQNGQDVGNVQPALTFTASGLSGSISLARTIAPTCTSNYNATGKRK